MNQTQQSIEIRGIKKSYSQGEFSVPVLKGFDLSIPEGQLVTMMGPSGSGKSTLLNILSAIESIDAGDVFVFGDNLAGKTEKALTEYRRKTIGIVFQFFHLLPYLSAIENVILPLYLQGYSKKEAKKLGAEALSLVHLSHRLNFTPKELSGGEKQRVAIARALVHKPKLILADEPTGNLDSESSDQIVKLFQSCVKDLGITIFLVTHNTDIGNLGDSRISMLDGIAKIL
ncbi:MAG: ABC transporter ATP-binding protein [Leptospira sp.]|jgi:ABC-type lipoprotein export system ATPase subunit|nr:ABC transporter ATP-binding protein [Leptospira sp.]